jgi:uncharacterized protein YjbI with pentapeptide repeats
VRCWAGAVDYIISSYKKALPATFPLVFPPIARHEEYQREITRKMGETNRARTACRCAVALMLAASSVPCEATEHLSADQVRQKLAGTAAGARLDLAGADMAGDNLQDLDLSGADLRKANLAHANLHGVRLVGTDLSGADLTSADLTETWIMRAHFDHAKLHGAILQVVITSQGMDNMPDTAASFVGADLSGTSATVHFSDDDMRGANFTDTRMSVVLANQSMGMLRSEFKSTDLRQANFTNAGLGRITFAFAKLEGAIFRNADLTRADFTGAYLQGADFTGAKLDQAVFDGATLTDVVGLKK